MAETSETSQELVRFSRAGDVFHYRWAARRCLQLIYPNTNLQRFFVEGSLERRRAGEYVIDVSEYSCHNSEEQVTYFQLKHSTTRVDQLFQLSDLRDTIEGFAKRFRDLKRNATGIRKVKFSLITNRPVAVGFKDGIRAIATGQLVKQNFQKTLEKYSGLKTKRLREFCSAIDLIDGEGNYIVQRDKLHAEVALLTADLHDPFEVDKFVTLVQEKVMPGNDGEIKKEEILQRFGVTSERELLPAPSEIQESSNLFQREQHDELLQTILTASSPVIIHASGGVGKSVVALQLSQSLPIGSVGILYDCFGSGKYRNPTEPRHQYRVACLQIANELAAKGLCEPLIAGSRDDALMRSLFQRMKAAAALLRQAQSDAVLVILIDAADNAEMAATEFSESCFANGLLREGIPKGCRIVALCRTERIQLLKPQSYVRQIELRVFSESESLRHLRTRFPKATNSEGQEFHRLSSKNPRVQANALDIQIKDTTVSSVLSKLGPSATTVDQQIEVQLESAVASVKDRLSQNYQEQIETICQGLANLPPFIPIDVLARAADVDRSVISSFASDLGRPLYLSENSVHFRDEPTETWFRQRFAVSASDIEKYAGRLKPLAAEIPYVASVLPALLLQSGQYDELIHLALSDESLPKDSAIDERNIRVYRLQFALKAALQRKRYADATKLALRAGEETAGEQRQLDLLTNNLDLIAPLQSSERVQELAFRRMLSGGWAGSENVYSAALLSFVGEFKGDSRGFQRSGREWLSLYFKEREKDKHHQDPGNFKQDIGEMATTVLNLDGAAAAVEFMTGWSPASAVFEVATFLTKRLIDAGDFKTIVQMTRAGSNFPIVILAICNELVSVGMYPIKDVLRVCLKTLIRDQSLHSIPEHEELDNRRASAQSALLALAEACGASGLNKKHILQILDIRFPKRINPYIVSTYSLGDLNAFLRLAALKSVLRQDLQPDLKQWFPEEWLEQKLGYEQNQKKEEFEQVFAYLFPWYLARVQIILGNSEALEVIFQNAEAQSGKSARSWFQGKEQLAFEVSRIRFECLVFHKTFCCNGSFANSLFEDRFGLKLSDQLQAVRTANRLEHLKEIRAPLELNLRKILKYTSDETPEQIATNYVQLARAVLATDHADAASYFDLAIEAVSKFGDEVVDRWGALTAMAERTSEATQGSPELAYRYIRCAELVGDSVIREKYWDRTKAIEVCFRLNPASGFTALSRWRDRYVGNLEQLLPALANVAVDSGQILPSVGWSLSAFSWEHSYIEFAVMCIEFEPNQIHQQFILDSAVRDLRLQDRLGEWQKLKDVAQKFSLNAGEVNKLLEFQANQPVIVKDPYTTPNPSGLASEPEKPDWSALLDDLNLVSSAGLGKAIQRFQKTPYPDWHEKIWQQIFSRIPDKNAKHVLEQLLLVENLNFYDLQTAVQQFPARFKQKVSVQRYWSDFIRQIARRFATKLCNPWTRKYFLDVLSSETNHIQLIREGIAEGLATSNDLNDAGALFGFCEVIAANISPQEARGVLEFALERFELHVNEGNADGAWAAWLEPPANIQEAFTGFLWSALGSPRSSERWMAAHSVRRLAETGCQSEIDLLVAWMTRDTVGAFIGRTFPFYNLHARLYLLIALARVAIDHPALLIKHADVFEHNALKGEPHALIQKYAAQIALSIEASFPATYATNTVAMLQTVGISQFPRKKSKGYKKRTVQTPWHARGEVDVTLKQYLAYDFDRYWFSDIDSMFGLQKNQVEELARELVFKKWQVQTADKSIIDPRFRLWNQQHTEHETWHHHDKYPRTDRYKFYLSYHAMLHIAAKLLNEIPIIEKNYDYDDNENLWISWLKRHDLTRTDGRWLADRRDPAPLKRPDWLSKLTTNSWKQEAGTSEADFLNGLLMSRDDNTWLCIDGYWDERDRDRSENISLSSVLVDPFASQALLNALSTCIDPQFLKLPNFQEEGMDLNGSPFELHDWTSRDYTSNGLDAFDPHAGNISYPPYSLDNNLTDRLGILADHENRIWVSKSGSESVICEIWGEYNKKDDVDPPERKGSRMFASLAFLKTLCTTMNCDLILKVQIERTFRESSYHRRNDKNGYRPPTCKVFLFSADGRLRTTTTSYQLR